MSFAQDPATLPLDRPSPVSDGFFRENYGGGLISSMVVNILYGLSVLQMYLYYLYYPNDGRMMKLLVVALFCISTVHTIFLCYTIYHYLIVTYQNPLLLIDGEWSLYMVPGTGVIICFLVQLFYTRMVYHLTRAKWRWFLTISLGLLILVQVAFGIEMLVKDFRVQPEGPSKLTAIARTSFVPMCAARVVSDSMTALSLCILLKRASPNLAGSGKLIHTLLVFSINRFLLTTVIVIVQMIVLICVPSSIWARCLDFISTHLYVNSCLATLNSRNYMRKVSESGMEPSDFLSTGHVMQFEPGNLTMSGDVSGLSTNVDLSTVRTSDIMSIEMGSPIKDRKADTDKTSRV